MLGTERTKRPQMDARKIVDLLAARHSKDIFVPECKNGPSQNSTHLRLDAWAMAKSWSKPFTWGYEIKVSRSDFLGDDKWHLYLPYCSHFYFVVPAGLVDPSEVPENAGLIYVSQTGTKLFTKRKAPWRQVTIPEDLYRYVLMCRTKITREYWDADRRLSKWREWLAEKEEKRKLGHEVSRAIQKHVSTVESQNWHLKSLMESYDDIRSMVVSLGLNPDSVASWTVERKIKDALAKVPSDVVEAIRGATVAIKRLQELFDPKAEPENEPMEDWA